MFSEAAKKKIMGVTGGVNPLAAQQGQGGGLMSALMQRVGMDQANNPFNQGGLAQAMAHAAGGSPQAAQPQQSAPQGLLGRVAAQAQGQQPSDKQAGGGFLGSMVNDGTGQDLMGLLGGGGFGQAMQQVAPQQPQDDPRVEKFRSMFGRDPVHPNELSLVS